MNVKSANECDPLAAMPKYHEKMARAFERVSGMAVDSVSAVGGVGYERVEVANTRGTLRETHIVDMAIVRAIFAASVASKRPRKGNVICGACVSRLGYPPTKVWPA